MLNKFFIAGLVATFSLSSFSQFNSAKIQGKVLLTEEKHGVKRNYQFGGTINGYQTNCKKTTIIVWGTPNEVSTDSPQIGYIAVLKSGHRKILFRKITSKELIDANFSNDGRHVELLYTDRATFDLKTGKINYSSTLNESREPSNEICKKEDWQHYSRWSLSTSNDSPKRN